MSKRRYYGDTVADGTERKGFGYYAKRLLTSSCVIYTIAVMFLAMVISLTNTGEDEGVVFFFDLVMLYPLSFLIACANMFFANKKYNFWLRLFSHALIIFTGFALYLLTVKQYEINSIGMLTPAFVVIYAVIMAVVLVLRNMKRRNEKDNEEYTDVYANVKNNIRAN